LIPSILNKFEPISLDQMDQVALMKRKDTKFIIHAKQLTLILQMVQSQYSILEIDGNRLMTYISYYYDTKEHKFYLDHHNKILRRTKVRIRNYVESGLFFLEIKQKDAKGNTLKNRIPRAANENILSSKSEQFIKQIINQNLGLVKTLRNSFKRITLVNTALKERVTIDLNLDYNGKILNPDLMIVELKQEKFNRQSPIVKALRKESIYPYSISKYCIGLASIYPKLKQNHFKQKISTITKLTA
jgi:hypothetical protein